jgi:CheY-like chemotaxis protein
MAAPNYRENPWILVEDDKDDQDFFVWAYKQAEIKNELILLNNGVQAVEYIKSTPKPPFVILSDINMPQMNGLELLKEIKSDRYTLYKSIPFLIISSSQSEKEIAMTYQAGAQGYFEKAMSVEEGVDLILNIKDYWSKCRHPALLKG